MFLEALNLLISKMEESGAKNYFLQRNSTKTTFLGENIYLLDNY